MRLLEICKPTKTGPAIYQDVIPHSLMNFQLRLLKIFHGLGFLGTMDDGNEGAGTFNGGGERVHCWRELSLLFGFDLASPDVFRSLPRASDDVLVGAEVMDIDVERSRKVLDFVPVQSPPVECEEREMVDVASSKRQNALIFVIRCGSVVRLHGDGHGEEEEDTCEYRCFTGRKMGLVRYQVMLIE